MYTIYYDSYYVTKYLCKNGNLFVARNISDDSKISVQFFRF